MALEINEGMTNGNAADILGDEPGTALAVRGSVALNLGQVDGHIDHSDLEFPRLTIAQAVGDVGAEFDQGTLVLGDVQLTSWDKKEGTKDVVKMVVISARKYFRDRLPYDKNGPRPAIYADEKEVAAAGKTLDWAGSQANRIAPSAEPVLECPVLIVKPDNVVSGRFGLEIEGLGPCAVGMWTLTRTGYTRAAKRILTARAIDFAQSNLIYGLWGLTVKQDTINGNRVFVPALSLIGRNSDTTVNEITFALSPK